MMRGSVTIRTCESSDGIQKERCEYIIELRTRATAAARTETMSARKDVRSAISRGRQPEALCSRTRASPS